VLRAVSLLALLFLSPLRDATAFEVPSLTGPVVDRAGLLSSATAQQISTALHKIRDANGAHIAVLTLPDLDGSTIEQVGIEVAEKWKLGTKDKDNGVILLVSKEERKIRIEVGQGLEGELPDAYASRIIAESMTPLFASGNIDEGILVGVFQIATKTNPQLDVQALFGDSARNWQRSQSESQGIPALIPIIVILLLLFGGRSTRGALFTAILLGGMGGRGGGGSGRSFRGSGGGFSGGGASGGW
jgi:uncharacterized protein